VKLTAITTALPVRLRAGRTGGGRWCARTPTPANGWDPFRPLRVWRQPPRRATTTEGVGSVDLENVAKRALAFGLVAASYVGVASPPPPSVRADARSMVRVRDRMTKHHHHLLFFFSTRLLRALESTDNDSSFSSLSLPLENGYLTMFLSYMNACPKKKKKKEIKNNWFPLEISTESNDRGSIFCGSVSVGETISQLSLDKRFTSLS